MNLTERVAAAMFGSQWPPTHPEDLAWWLNLAEAAINALKEPSDAQVRTALEAFYGGPDAVGVDLFQPEMRAALKAAREVRDV